MTTKNLQVGFIGLGAMGMGMAKSLLRAGLAVKGYDINPAAVTQFTEAGGQGAATVADAARGADVVVIVVLNADQVTDVLFGKGAAADALAAGSVVLADVPPHVTVAGVPARVVGPAGTPAPGRTMDQTFDPTDSGMGPDDYAML